MLLSPEQNEIRIPSIWGQLSVAGDFAIWLKRMRAEKGLTLEALAQRIGSTKTTIQRYESGNRPVPFEVMLQLADALPVARSIATAVWVEANGGEMTYHADPDTIAMAEAYEGLPTPVKSFIRSQILSAADLARELDRKETLGGTRSDNDVNPTRYPDD